MPEIKTDVVLDTKGLHCPLPILKTKKAIDNLQIGQILKVIATDPGVKTDIPALLRRLGHELVEFKEDNGTYFFYIKKK